MESALEATPFPKVKGYAVEWIDENGFLLSRRNKLYASKDLNRPFSLVGAWPAPLHHRVLSHHRAFQRLFRYFYYNVIRLSENRIFTTFQKSVGLFENGEFVGVTGLVRPSRFLRGACAVDPSGGVYLGEYLSNQDRGVMRVYYLPPGSKHLEVVHQFEPGEIRHIHGLYFDAYENYIWLLTGDLENECNVLRTRDGFKTLETVGCGDETWRTVSMVFREDAVYYGMDAEFRANHVYKIDRKTLERTQLFEVDGPVYYSVNMGDHLVFGVTAEGCPSQKENRAALWAVDQNDKGYMAASYPKDRYPNILMPGTLHFPLGPGMPNKLFCYCLGLQGVDDQTLLIQAPPG